MFTANSFFVAKSLMTYRLASDTFVTSCFMAKSLMTDRLASDAFVTKSFTSDALLSVTYMANRHVFSDALMTGALVASGSFVASLKKTFLIAEKRSLFDIMASSLAMHWFMVEVILHFIVVEIMCIVVVKAMVHSAFMEVDWLDIMGVIKCVLQAAMVTHMSVHMHHEVCRVVSSDLLLHCMLG